MEKSLHSSTSQVSQRTSEFRVTSIIRIDLFEEGELYGARIIAPGSVHQFVVTSFEERASRVGDLIVKLARD